MNGLSDFDREQGEKRVEQEIATQAIKASQAVSQEGSNICVDCDEPIEPERKQAAPFSVRCITCQQISELR